MAIKYRVKTKPDNINGQESPKYYAVPVRSGEVNLRMIAKDIANRSSISAGDVFATLMSMIPIVENYLHNGYSVRIDELGIFTISASSKGFDKKEDCLPHRVEARKICFRADASLKRNLKNVKFKRDEK